MKHGANGFVTKPVDFFIESKIESTGEMKVHGREEGV